MAQGITRVVTFGRIQGERGVAGPPGENAYTETLEAFIQPSEGDPGVFDSVVVLVASTALLAEDQVVFIAGGGYYRINSIDSATAITATPHVESVSEMVATPGNPVASGALVTPCGPKGSKGAAGPTGAPGEGATMDVITLSVSTTLAASRKQIAIVQANGVTVTLPLIPEDGDIVIVKRLGTLICDVATDPESGQALEAGDPFSLDSPSGGDCITLIHSDTEWLVMGLYVK